MKLQALLLLLLVTASDIYGGHPPGSRYTQTFPRLNSPEAHSSGKLVLYLRGGSSSSANLPGSKEEQDKAYPRVFDEEIPSSNHDLEGEEEDEETSGPPGADFNLPEGGGEKDLLDYFLAYLDSRLDMHSPRRQPVYCGNTDPLSLTHARYTGFGNLSRPARIGGKALPRILFRWCSFSFYLFLPGMEVLMQIKKNKKVRIQLLICKYLHRLCLAVSTEQQIVGSLQIWRRGRLQASDRGGAQIPFVVVHSSALACQTVYAPG
jgi:hypothetical protein